MTVPILMADIIESRRKNPIETQKQFKKVVETINKKWSKKILSPLTITLGDEFQGVVNSVPNGILLIFDLEETLLKFHFDFKLRYVLHIGEIDTKINRKIAYGMMGSGLTNARNDLNKLKKEDRRFLINFGTDSDYNHQLNNAFFVFQGIIDTWKQKDLEVVYSFILHSDYKKVAKEINVDISSAWRRKKSLLIKEYIAIKEVINFLVHKYAN